MIKNLFIIGVIIIVAKLLGLGGILMAVVMGIWGIAVALGVAVIGVLGMVV
jgi:hypothetical protein